MRKKLLAFGAGVVLGLSEGSIVAQQTTPPWMKPENPTKLEWLAIYKQATEGRTDFGSSGVEINFYLTSEGVRKGQVECDIDYLPTVSAAVLQLVEEGIEHRVEIDRKVNPWERVHINAKVVNVPPPS